MSGIPAPVARSGRKKVVRAHGWGDVSHNMATGTDPVVVTVWGRADNEPDRVVGLDLDEEGVRRMVASLRLYGLL